MEELITIERFMVKLVNFTQDILPSDKVAFEWMEHEGSVYATVVVDVDVFEEGDE
jgi:hypothetical protein